MLVGGRWREFRNVLVKGLLCGRLLPTRLQLLSCSFRPPRKVEEERNGFPSHSETDSRAWAEVLLGWRAVAVCGSINPLLCDSESGQAQSNFY